MNQQRGPTRLGAEGIPEEKFRSLVTAWFAKNAMVNWEQVVDRLSEPEYLALQRDWLRQLNTRGLAAPHVASEWGGGGYTLAEQAIIYEEWARSGALSLPAYAISLFHVPATLLTAGTPEQQARFVRQAIDGTIWCQGFSEPEAGSDLASLRTRATLVDDHFVINGQKIWSSRAHWADWCLLLARTDPVAPPHKGISYLIMDMHAPGVDVRPIRQNTGHSEFCEIFLDDVRVPASNLIGDLNNGWLIAQKTLSTERGPIALETIERISLGLTRMLASVPATASRGPLSYVEVELGRLIARASAVRSLARDAITETDRSGSGTGLSSIIKVSFSELLREMTDLGTGLSAESSLVSPHHAHPRSWVSGHWMSDFVRSWAWTIAGGTNEIQRNIISERMLHLPRELQAP
jgi:alkylation response protein AidB-like acyl-CoA dehydrogenase